MTLKYIWRSLQSRLSFPRPFQLSVACFRVARSPSNSWASCFSMQPNIQWNLQDICHESSFVNTVSWAKKITTVLEISIFPRGLLFGEPCTSGRDITHGSWPPAIQARTAVLQRRDPLLSAHAKGQLDPMCSMQAYHHHRSQPHSVVASCHTQATTHFPSL